MPIFNKLFNSNSKLKNNLKCLKNQFTNPLLKRKITPKIKTNTIKIIIKITIIKKTIINKTIPNITNRISKIINRIKINLINLIKTNLN